MASDNAPDISVVIPVWDRQELLRRAVDSALRQDGVRQEVIVVDDGSIPPLDLASIGDPRLRVVRHDANRGPAAARNTGVALAEGRYIAFLDSDDFWHPRKLALQLAAAREAGDGTVIGCGWRYRRGGVGRIVIPIDADEPVAFAAGAWHGAGTTMLVPRSVIVSVGLQDEGLKRLEDFDWYLRFAAAGGRLKVVPEPLVTIDWRPHDDWCEIDRASRRLVGRHLGPASPHSRAVQRRIRAYAFLIRSSRRWHAGRRATALWLLLRSWLLVPRARVFLDRPDRRSE